MAKAWTTDVYQLAGTSTVDNERTKTFFNVPGGATLLRTIVDASIAQEYTIGAAPEPTVFAPIVWWIGDLNSDVEPHPLSGNVFEETDGVPLIAHGMISPRYDMVNRLTTEDGNLGIVGVGGQDYSATFASQTVIYVTGRDHADSHAQRNFFSGHPELITSIATNLPFDIAFNNDVPQVVLTVRHLWDVH